jgi:hypothetical protein
MPAPPADHDVGDGKAWDLLKKPSYLTGLAGAACLSVAG